MTPAHSSHPCILALEDGTVMSGLSFGAEGTRAGEVVFNTAMTGYQEIITDPSYCGQIVTMTYPLIGNYGVNHDDVESDRPQVRGLVIKELARRPSSFRATMRLEDYLAQNDVIGLQGIDTRCLAKKLRIDGALRGVITTELDDPGECIRLARQVPSMNGADLVKLVAPKKAGVWSQGFDGTLTSLRRDADHRHNVVAVDCGMKRNILRHLVDVGCAVAIVPPNVSAAELLDHRPDGVFVSNGPGDPAAVNYAIDLLRGLVGRIPIFGICLGHQLLGLAMGATTFKLKFGHRGANQPVRNLTTGRVEITSQNHGFAVDQGSLQKAGGTPTHANLNDGTLEGFVHRDLPILGVQFHPEAGPGPHDASYLFDCFARMMVTGKAPTGTEMAEAQSTQGDRSMLRK